MKQRLVNETSIGYINGLEHIYPIYTRYLFRHRHTCEVEHKINSKPTYINISSVFLQGTVVDVIAFMMCSFYGYCSM